MMMVAATDRINTILKLAIIDFHNYATFTGCSQCSVSDTFGVFQAQGGESSLTVEEVQSFIDNEGDIRKSTAHDLIKETLVNYLVNWYMINPLMDVSLLVNISNHFNSIFNSNILDVNTIQQRKSLYSNYGFDFNASIKDETSRILQASSRYSPNNVFYLSDIVLNLNFKVTLTLSLMTNITGSEFSQPMLITNIPNNSFNYYPSGLINHYQLISYLYRINLKFVKENRKIILFLESKNHLLEKYLFSNIELVYINPKFDHYSNRNHPSIKLPDAFGLNDWLKFHLTSNISNDSINEENIGSIISSVLKKYNECTTKLLYEALYYEFNQLNIAKSNLKSFSNVSIPLDKFVVKNDILRIANEYMVSANSPSYTYSIKDIYYIILKLLKWENNTDIDSTINESDENQILNFLIKDIYPYLLFNESPILNSFHSFLNAFINQHINEGNPLIQGKQQQMSPILLNYESQHLGPLTEALKIEHEIKQNGNSGSITSGPTSSTPTKRARSLSGNEIDGSSSPTTIKRTKILELLKKDKLSFLEASKPARNFKNGKSAIFSDNDDDEDSEDDSFASKVRQSSKNTSLNDKSGDTTISNVDSGNSSIRRQNGSSGDSLTSISDGAQRRKIVAGKSSKEVVDKVPTSQHRNGAFKTAKDTKVDSSQKLVESSKAVGAEEIEIKEKVEVESAEKEESSNKDEIEIDHEPIFNGEIEVIANVNALVEQNEKPNSSKVDFDIFNKAFEKELQGTQVTATPSSNRRLSSDNNKSGTTESSSEEESDDESSDSESDDDSEFEAEESDKSRKKSVLVSQTPSPAQAIKTKSILKQTPVRINSILQNNVSTAQPVDDKIVETTDKSIDVGSKIEITKDAPIKRQALKRNLSTLDSLRLPTTTIETKDSKPKAVIVAAKPKFLDDMDEDDESEDSSSDSSSDEESDDEKGDKNDTPSKSALIDKFNKLNKTKIDSKISTPVPNKAKYNFTSTTKSPFTESQDLHSSEFEESSLSDSSSSESESGDDGTEDKKSKVENSKVEDPLVKGNDIPNPEPIKKVVDAVISTPKRASESAVPNSPGSNGTSTLSMKIKGSNPRKRTSNRLLDKINKSNVSSAAYVKSKATPKKVISKPVFSSGDEGDDD